MRIPTIACPTGKQPRPLARRAPRMLALLALCWLAAKPAWLSAQEAWPAATPSSTAQPWSTAQSRSNAQPWQHAAPPQPGQQTWLTEPVGGEVRPLPPLPNTRFEQTLAPTVTAPQPLPWHSLPTQAIAPLNLDQPGFLDAPPANAEQSPFRPTAFFDPNIDVTVPSVADPPLETPIESQQLAVLPPPALPATGPYQQSLFSTTYVGGSDLGLTTFDMRSIFAFPLPNEDSPLLLTPGYGWTLVDGPRGIDLPSQFHEAYLDIRYIKRFTPALLIDLGLTPGLYSDFEGSHPDAFRLGARGLVAMTYSPTVQIVAGVAYLDREDVEFLPLGGIVWTPSDDVRLELVSPRPRYMQRMWKEGYREAWWYVAGELGGGSWAMARRCGCSDVVNYYDARAVLGWELKNEQGLGALFEAGYVFYRNLEYLSGGPAYEPDDTFVVRAGLTF